MRLRPAKRKTLAVSRPKMGKRTMILVRRWSCRPRLHTNFFQPRRRPYHSRPPRQSHQPPRAKPTANLQKMEMANQPSPTKDGISKALGPMARKTATSRREYGSSATHCTKTQRTQCTNKHIVHCRYILNWHASSISIPICYSITGRFPYALHNTVAIYYDQIVRHHPSHVQVLRHYECVNRITPSLNVYVMYAANHSSSFSVAAPLPP